MGTQAKSDFEILTWDQDALPGADGGVMATRTTSRHRLSGDIEGEAVAELLMAHAGETYAGIMGMFRVTGSIAGRSGTFVLRNNAVFESGAVRGEVSVVPGSATGELAGLSGDGEYRSEGTRAGVITLDYDLG
ncbi:hypothetical protein FHS29_000356 [Saccharothrix tamanrassetensis]|uniref:DUF3224 domain-containing protein n=1 Tax=Saccharothrix tamanrassetensis TaxID=1051531 RepID=A0A841CDE9_9PSEU|nr:DUF3224 domain-containing protein [Saccharothrix tamanrassetensis]MBB5953786.1 hypothetical protein [Saccharothrix tamanrassetensis]